MKYKLPCLPPFILCMILSPVAIAEQSSMPQASITPAPTAAVVATPAASGTDEQVTNSIAFMHSLANCDQLLDKGVMYRTSTTGFLRIYSSPPTFCILENIDTARPTASQKQVCYFSKEQISSMVTPEAFKIMEQFETSHDNPNEVKTLFKPLVDCTTHASTAQPSQPLVNPASPPVPKPAAHYDYRKMIN